MNSAGGDGLPNQIVDMAADSVHQAAGSARDRVHADAGTPPVRTDGGRVCLIALARCTADTRNAVFLTSAAPTAIGVAQRIGR